MCNTRCTPYILSGAGGMYHLRPVKGSELGAEGLREEGLGV